MNGKRSHFSTSQIKNISQNSAEIHHIFLIRVILCLLDLTSKHFKPRTGLILMDLCWRSRRAAPCCVSFFKVKHHDQKSVESWSKTSGFGSKQEVVFKKEGMKEKQEKLVTSSATAYVTFCDHCLNVKTLAASLLKAKFFHRISAFSTWLQLPFSSASFKTCIKGLFSAFASEANGSFNCVRHNENKMGYY